MVDPSATAHRAAAVAHLVSEDPEAWVQVFALAPSGSGPDLSKPVFLSLSEALSLAGPGKRVLGVATTAGSLRHHLGRAPLPPFWTVDLT